MKVAFAPIDARDGVVGYDTVGFVAPQPDGYENYMFPATAQMYELCDQMQAEYLTRLHALQEELRVKYEAQAQENGFTNDYDVRDALETTLLANGEHAAIEARTAATFPGPKADYYT